MIKRILVGLAGTDYTEVAVRRAAELAQIHGAEITGVTVMDPSTLHTGSVPSGAGSTARELREHRIEVSREHILQAIANFEDTCSKLKIPHQTLREEGNVFRLVTHLARFHDCTIFGLRSVFEYFFEDGDSSTLLIRLMSEGVRPIIATAKTYRPIHKVLLAYSGSMESARTIRRFVQERLWPDISLKIVTFGPREKEAQQRLSEAAEYCKAHGFDSQTQYIKGSPSIGLLQHAVEWDADLIVLGNSTHSLLRRQIFSDTTMHTIKNADRPLFLSH